MSVGDVNSADRGSGARYNTGKVALDLVPLSSLEDCARVFDYGRNKYAAWNWAKGMDWSIPYACALRHLSAWFRGEDNDPESGLPHLGHVMCNLVMLSTYARTFPEGDNRPKEWLNLPAGQALDSVSMEPPTVAFEADPVLQALIDRADEEAPLEGLTAGKAYMADFGANPIRQDDEE